MPHLAILVHAEHQLSEASLLARLVEVWRGSGLRVTVVRGYRDPPDADAVFLHVNLTVVPDEYMALVGRYPAVINGGVSDISKRRISRSLVRESEPVEGPVIVKTDRNYGGIGEYRLALKSGLRNRLASFVRNCLPWTMRSSLTRYRIFDSVHAVPRAVWRNPHLVVERFLPEVRDGKYCLRTWLFLGSQERMALFHSSSPIIKSRTIESREPLTEVPEDLRAMRKELGFDFGKFDFGVVDGRTVLYDANRTPVLGATTPAAARPWLEQLAEGIWDYLPRSS